MLNLTLIADPTLLTPYLSPSDRLLVLASSASEWTATMAAHLIAGILVLQTDEEQVDSARLALQQHENVMVHAAMPPAIPWQDGFFTAIVVVASPDLFPSSELIRVLAPQGRLYLPDNENFAAASLPLAELSAPKGWQAFQHTASPPPPRLPPVLR